MTRIMCFAPAPATRKVLGKPGLKLSQMDVIELNEAFAAQALAVTRDLGLPDDAGQVNPNGGAIAIGHRLGASGAASGMTAPWPAAGGLGMTAWASLTALGKSQSPAGKREPLAHGTLKFKFYAGKGWAARQ